MDDLKRERKKRSVDQRHRDYDYTTRERKELDYDYRGGRTRDRRQYQNRSQLREKDERQRSRSPVYRAAKRYRYRSPRGSEENHQQSLSCERSVSISTSQSFLSPSVTPAMSPSPGSPLGSSTPIMNNNLTTNTVCQETDMKIFLTKSLRKLGLRDKEVSEH